MIIKKAVIPAAGLGTRFLPVTKAVPKVMLPVLDTPAIEYSVREAALAGIEHAVIVISAGQTITAEYFQSCLALSYTIRRGKENKFLATSYSNENKIQISFVYQDKPLGLGHAILMAKEEIGQNPFAVFLPDDVIFSDEPTIREMCDYHTKHKGCVIAARRVSDEEIPHLGIFDAGVREGKFFKIKTMIEKPTLESAPSNLAIVGRYVLTPGIFDALADTAPGAKGEIQLTDGLNGLVADEEACGYEFPGQHFDVGTPLGMLKASIFAGMKRKDVSAELKDWLNKNT